MRFNTLDQWLAWQETLHPTEIDLGLDRIRQVQSRMGLAHPSYITLTIAGTNGKGSCATLLNAIYLAAGYRVGLYTSPHLKNYNERIQVDGVPVPDEMLCESFARIDRQRAETSLTYFEFGTLAAIDIFTQADVDIAIMEVGLGGRLDAVNILDADAVLISAIGLDHQNWLGNSRDEIAREKIAVAREKRPVVCGDVDPPSSLLEYADTIQAPVYRINREFSAEMEGDMHWRWRGPDQVRPGLPLPAMKGEFQLMNAASVLMLIQLMLVRLPVSQAHIRHGLLTSVLPGRFQVTEESGIRIIIDVAHNIQAAQALAANVKAITGSARNHGVFAALNDKDIAGILDAMRDQVSAWYFANLNHPRGSDAGKLAEIAKAIGITVPIKCYRSVKLAKEAAILNAAGNSSKSDQIIVFGSFYTASEVL